MLSTRTCPALNPDRACLEGQTSSTAVEPSKPSSRESQAIGSDLHSVDDPWFTPGGYEFKRLRSQNNVQRKLLRTTRPVGPTVFGDCCQKLLPGICIRFG